MRSWKAVRIAVGLLSEAALAHGAPTIVTEQEVRVAQAKVAEAQKYFATTWADLFRARGESFSAPRVYAFNGTINTGCGELKPGNGYTCYKDNTIYMDALLLTGAMKRASVALHTDGDYAPIAIAAHEFGHVVAKQAKLRAPFTVDIGWASESLWREQTADCFAGVVTRHAKTDRLLDPGDLQEALFALAEAGDSPSETGVSLLPPKEDNQHGDALERQSAFLQGYYGGPGFCGLGQARQPSTGPTLNTQSLVVARATTETMGQMCAWSYDINGLHVRNPRLIGNCILNLIPANTALPDHARIEITMARQNSFFIGSLSSAGILYGDTRSATTYTQYAFELTGSDSKKLSIVGDSTIGGAIGLRSPVAVWTATLSSPRDKKRLTLDIHHEGNDVFFITYVNGTMESFGISKADRTFRMGNPDQAGVWVREPGGQAVFTNLWVASLPN